MKKLYSFLILILIGYLNQLLVNAQTIQPVERSVGKLQISVDPRMEILTTVQLLSNSPYIRRDLSYSKDVMDYFKSFSSNEAVVMTDSLLQKYGFALDAPVAFMLYLSQLPVLEQQIAYKDYLKGRSGRGDNLEKYRKSIKQFAEISNFETFWSSRIPFYNEILDLTIAEMGELDFVKILENYYNDTFESYNIIISPSFIGGFGPTITDTDGNDIIYACIPNFNGMQLRGFIWHEFGHSFVNPLVDKYSDRLVSLNKLFEPIKEDMKIAAGNWTACVKEHVVRAVVVRLFELYVDPEFSKIVLESELKQRFIYIEPLVEKLKDFENQRDKNKITFSDYYPELLNVLESLLP